MAEALALDGDVGGEEQGRDDLEIGQSNAPPHLRVEGYEGPLDFLLEWCAASG
ncbi:hypothetical protein [Roseomonas sp. KE2513]|uniref:hypothetical protein n=1 Tax=Roseomonas sp. KE2513 TaxID=2479202 RepID=UPI0018DEF338|nr:hypothetical protein [Roseomonas sp. KE2513]